MVCMRSKILQRKGAGRREKGAGGSEVHAAKGSEVHAAKGSGRKGAGWRCTHT